MCTTLLLRSEGQRDALVGRLVLLIAFFGSELSPAHHLSSVVVQQAVKAVVAHLPDGRKLSILGPGSTGPYIKGLAARLS